ncbi:MAG: hypothetical protein B7X76_07935, partial [Azorhizobium sp. 39-67-5]
QDKKAFATAAILACALIAGAPAGIAESPVMGDAGMGTATGPAAAPPVPAAGDAAPSHLHGQAPAPGDASPEQRQAAPRAAETAPQQPSQASAIATPAASGGVERVLEAIRPVPSQAAASPDAASPAASSSDAASSGAPSSSTSSSSASSSAPQPADATPQAPQAPQPAGATAQAAQAPQAPQASEEDPQAAIDRMAQPANAELTAPPAALTPPPRAAALPQAQPEAAAASSSSSSAAGASATSPAPVAPSVAAVPPSPPVDTTPAQAAAPAPSAPAPSAPTRTAEPAPPTPAPAAVAADPLAPIAEQIAKLLAVPGADALVGSAKEQEALLSFYTARMDAPVFVDASGFNARGKAVLARFAAAGEDGLEPSDYARPRLSPGADPLALARAELKLAATALLYARHAEAGRFDPSRISQMIAATRTFPDAREVLS